MHTKKRHEGYLLIDHRDSPGLSEEQVARSGLAASGLPLGGGHGLTEIATVTCSHCCTVVMLNPHRARPREWCAKCDHYICDRCSRVMAASGECLPFAKIVERHLEAASKLV